MSGNSTQNGSPPAGHATCLYCKATLPPDTLKCVNCGEFQHRRSRCVVCGEHIPVGAKKCNHCDSFQGRRRHWQFGSSLVSVLSLMVAAILSLTVVEERWGCHSSRTKAYYIACTSDQVTYLFINSGDRPAYLLEGHFQWGPYMAVRLAPLADESDWVITPEKTLAMQFKPAIPPPTYEWPKDTLGLRKALSSECTGIFVIQMHDESIDSLKVTAEPWRLQKFLDAYARFPVDSLGGWR